MWVWLESQATCLGLDPHMSVIVTDDAWWEQQEESQMKKGVSTFKNDPLKHIDLHNTVFRGCTVVGNHSDVAGASPTAPHAQAHWQTVDVAQLTATYMPPMPSPPAPESTPRGKGKRAVIDSAASGGSSKKSAATAPGRPYKGLPTYGVSPCIAGQERQPKLSPKRLRHAWSWLKTMDTVSLVRCSTLLVVYSRIPTTAHASS